MADGHLFNNIALSGRGAPSQEAINLGVRTKDGLSYKFTGFRDQDVEKLNSFFQNTCGITPDEKHLSVSGRNWGDVDLNGENI